MTYEARETSDFDGAPVELYEFIGADGTAYRYTSAPVNIQRGGTTYLAMTMERNALKAGTQDGDKHTLEITIPINTALVQDYATRISPPSLRVTIYRYQEGESPLDDAVIYWVGPIVSFKLSDDIAKVNSTSIFGSALGGNVPSIYFQSPCNWVLFDGQCRASRALWEFPETVVDLGVSTIQINTVPGSFTIDQFVGGEVVCTRTSERRMIVSAVGTTFTINYPFADLTIGDDINIAAGCDHSFTTCRDKFANASRFGGHRFIPFVNPFAEGI